MTDPICSLVSLLHIIAVSTRDGNEFQLCFDIKRYVCRVTTSLISLVSLSKYLVMLHAIMFTSNYTDCKIGTIKILSKAESTKTFIKSPTRQLLGRWLTQDYL